MRIWCLMCGLRPRERFRLMGKILAYGVSTALLVVFQAGSAIAQSGPLVLERDGRAISLEPYAPNILRVTMSTDRAAATGAPGYGFVAQAFSGGMDARARRRRVRCVPIGPDGSARRAGRSCRTTSCRSPMPLDALNLRAAPTLFWRRWWRERSKRRRPWSAQRCACW